MNTVIKTKILGMAVLVAALFANDARAQAQTEQQPPTQGATTPHLNVQLQVCNPLIRLRVYHTEWCPACRQMRQFFTQHGIGTRNTTVLFASRAQGQQTQSCGIIVEMIDGDAHPNPNIRAYPTIQVVRGNRVIGTHRGSILANSAWIQFLSRYIRGFQGYMGTMEFLAQSEDGRRFLNQMGVNQSQSAQPTEPPADGGSSQGFQEGALW